VFFFFLIKTILFNNEDRLVTEYFPLTLIQIN